MYKKLTKEVILEIQALWDAIEERESDISTEGLFAMVQDIYNKGKSTKFWIDAGDISEALSPENDPESKYI
jgi:hypothetical protein